MIRKAHEREGLSVRALAERFGTHRRTVRHASSRRSRRRESRHRRGCRRRWSRGSRSSTGGWRRTRTCPRKQRHTARRVWQRLVEEHDAEVGESTVRRYVRDARTAAWSAASGGDGAPAPSARRRGGGGLRPGELLPGRRPGRPAGCSSCGCRPREGRSTASTVNQAQEAFLDGHVRAFEHFGGVPGRIRYDNLKPAVVQVLKGRDRIESERFVVLRSHYGFDSFFCRPGIEGAHEKGGVEGEVGRFRRRHLVPVPQVVFDGRAERALWPAATSADDRASHLRPGG